MYSKADHLITPTPYSKTLLEGYGIKVPISAISNGIDLSRFYPSEEKEQKFREYFKIDEEKKVIICVGLFLNAKESLILLKLRDSYQSINLFGLVIHQCILSQKISDN